MNDMSSCRFCKQLISVKEIDEWYLANSKRHRDAWFEYKAALITERYEEGIDWCTGTCTYQSMELNFCPVCGKDLRG